MSKKAVMISIDEEVHNKIKEKGLNVSAEVERALKNKLTDKQKNMYLKKRKSLNVVNVVLLKMKVIIVQKVKEIGVKSVI